MNKPDVKKLILLNLPYVFAFYFADKIAAVFRLAPGTEFIDKLTNGFAVFGSAFANPLPSFHPVDLLIGLSAGVLLKLAVYVKGKNRKKFRQGEEYGSARWGKSEDIKPYMDPEFSNNVILTQTEFLTMNSRPKQPKYAKYDRAEFVRVVQEAQSSQQTAEVRKQRTRLATAKQRVSELEVLLCKIYEDNILGKLSDSRYATLDAQYEKEQSELTAEISALEKAIKSYEKHEKDADRFIALIDKYENFDKLTIAMLNEFIEKILVHERDRKGSIQTTQEVEIYFNFVGRFVPPAFGEEELTPEELEEIRKREERKDRLHQNYLKRKASGAQKRYEDKIKKRKKAEIEAKKAAIRAEDIAKGVFVPVSSLPQREPMKGVQTA